jgi:hypothetical protein
MVKKLLEAHEKEHTNSVLQKHEKLNVLPSCKQRIGQYDWLL